MNRIPKCKAKYFIPHQNNLKIAQKESFNEHLVPKITQWNLKFSANRNFGKDISNSIKNNIQNSNHSKKISAEQDKINNNIYIKKHSSASQVAQKTQKIKIAINDKKLRENKSGANINKKSDISINKEINKNITLKREKVGPANGSKLHSSISFGINNGTTIGNRPYTGNAISVRLPSNKNNKLRNSSNNKISINKSNNNIASLGNNKNEMTASNLNIM